MRLCARLLRTRSLRRRSSPERSLAFTERNGDSGARTAAGDRSFADGSAGARTTPRTLGRGRQEVGERGEERTSGTACRRRATSTAARTGTDQDPGSTAKAFTPHGG